MPVNIGDIEGRIILTDKFTAVFDKAVKQMESNGRRLTDIGSQLTRTITLPITALGLASVKLAADFESSFTGVKKTLEATPEQLDVIARSFRDLSKEIPVNVNLFNQIGESAGQLGIAQENVVSFTRTIADLSVTTDLTAETAATGFARIVNITGIAQDQFSNMGSTVVDLGNKYAAFESEILNVSLRIAGAGTIAGFAVPEIFAIGAALTSVGVQAEAGGTAVQKVILNITQAVATGGEKLELFAATAGMSSDKFVTAWRDDAAGAFTDFVEGLGKQGDKAFDILENLELADQRLIRAFLSLANAGDLLSTTFETATAAYRENVALTEEAEKRYKTFTSQVIILWNRLKDVGITLGDAVIPVFESLINSVMVPGIKVLTKWANKFEQLSKPLKITTVGTLALTAATGPMLVVFGSLMVIVAQASIALPILATGIIAVKAAVLAFNPILAVGTVVVGGFMLAVNALAKEISNHYDKAIKEMVVDSDRLMNAWDDLTEAIKLQNEALLQSKITEYIEQVDALTQANKLLQDTRDRFADTTVDDVLKEQNVTMERAKEIVRDLQTRYHELGAEWGRNRQEIFQLEELIERAHVALNNIATPISNAGDSVGNLTNDLSLTNDEMEEFIDLWNSLPEALVPARVETENYRTVIQSLIETQRELNEEIERLQGNISARFNNQPIIIGGGLTPGGALEGLDQDLEQFFTLNLPSEEDVQAMYDTLFPLDDDQMKEWGSVFGKEASAHIEVSLQQLGGAVSAGIDSFVQALGQGVDFQTGTIVRAAQIAFDEILAGIFGPWGALISILFGGVFQVGAQEAFAELTVLDQQLQLTAHTINAVGTAWEQNLTPVLQAFVDNIISTTNLILAEFGGILESGQFGFKIRTGPETDIVRVFYLGLVAEFENQADAVSFLIAKIISESTVSGLSVSMSEAIARTDFSSIEELVSALDFARSIDLAIGTPLQQFISRVASDARILMITAADLGINLNRAAQAMIIQAQAAVDQAAAFVLSAAGMDPAIAQWQQLNDNIAIVSKEGIAQLEEELQKALEAAVRAAQTQERVAEATAGTTNALEEFLATIEVTDAVSARIAARFQELHQAGIDAAEIVNILIEEFEEFAVALEGVNLETINRAVTIFRQGFLGSLFSQLADLAERTGQAELAARLRARAEELSIRMQLLAIRTTIQMARAQGLLVDAQVQHFNRFIQEIQRGFNEIMREGGFGSVGGGGGRRPPAADAADDISDAIQQTFDDWEQAALFLAQTAENSRVVAQLQHNIAVSRVQAMLEEQRAAFLAGEITAERWQEFQDLASQALQQLGDDLQSALAPVIEAIAGLDTNALVNALTTAGDLIKPGSKPEEVIANLLEPAFPDSRALDFDPSVENLDIGGINELERLLSELARMSRDVEIGGFTDLDAALARTSDRYSAFILLLEQAGAKQNSILLARELKETELQRIRDRFAENQIQAIEETDRLAERLIERLRRAKEGIGNILDAQARGEFGGITPEVAIATAEQQFNDIFAAAMGGDIDALENAGDAYKNFIDILQEQQASGPVFAAGLAEMTDKLQQLQRITTVTDQGITVDERMWRNRMNESLEDIVESSSDQAETQNKMLEELRQLRDGQRNLSDRLLDVATRRR